MGFLESPLGRHPRLLGRKVLERLGWHSGKAEVPAPPVQTVTYPDHWGPALRAWTKTISIHAAPHPFNKVFQQEFDEGLLLKLCRQGPDGSEPGLRGDIKLVWDYSRGQPLFTNAATGPGEASRCAEFIIRWLEAASDTDGPTWTCAMEIGIRATNWILADVLFRGELASQIGSSDWARWLWRHGWLIWRRLEARRISSNHYLADLLGLFLVGSIFPQDKQARFWKKFAGEEFPRALLAQTRADGGLDEASLRYHAFVAELALLFRLAKGTPWPAPAEQRLRAMCRIVADFSDASGDVFALGDDDSGRVLALDSASNMGRAPILLNLASSVLGETFAPSAEAVYPASGWWVARAGEFAVALDFGGVGLEGAGAHAHNDDFSFCLDWKKSTVIADPGTYLYTGDKVARNRFRSTRYHNTLILDDREQRPLGNELFELAGRNVAYRSEIISDGCRSFTRNLEANIVHRRAIEVRRDVVRVSDSLEGSGRHRSEWRFNLHPLIQTEVIAKSFKLNVSGAGVLAIEASDPNLLMSVSPSEFSAGYGRLQPSLVCVASGEFSLPYNLTWTIRETSG